MPFSKNDATFTYPKDALINCREQKRIVEGFDKYINSKKIDYELKSMKTTQWYMIDRIREVWNDIKKGEYE